MSVVSTPDRTKDGPFAKLVEQEWQTLLDKDDRTSPAEYPDMCLVSRLELSWAMAEAWFSAKSSGAQPLGSSEAEDGLVRDRENRLQPPAEKEGR